MGLCLTNRKSKYTFYMSSGGFHNLRKNIALCFDEELGEAYGDMNLCIKDEKAYDKRINDILSDLRFTEDDAELVDFLFASDIEGKCNYKLCGRIYNLIKDKDFKGKIFTYAAYSDGNDYEYFKEFVKECYSKRRNMVWY